MKKKSFLLATLLTGCVKYNGRSSSNYSEDEDEIAIALSSSKLAIDVGETASLSANVDKPSEITWTIENNTIASLENNSGTVVTFNALAVGTTTITATAVSGTAKDSASCELTVLDPGSARPFSLSLSHSALTVTEGEKTKLEATVDVSTTVYWSISDDSLATLSSPTGSSIDITTLKPGIAVITASATYEGFSLSKTCQLTITRKSTPGGDDPTIPIIGEEVTTYLVIGENGRYNGEAGKDIASLYLEYTVEFVAKVGEPLPTATEITSTVEGSTFKYWQCYEGNGALTQYTTVPNARGKILYAYYSGGSGSVTPTPTPEPDPIGSITLYFAGIESWTDETTVNLGIKQGESINFKEATKQTDKTYKATLDVTTAIASVNAYLKQGDKYFHPTTGTKDYNDMNSVINTGSVAVEVGKSYTISFVDWHYNNEAWTHAWFNYTFTEGTPSQVPDTPDDPDDPVVTDDTITVYFAGVDGWSIKEVHIAFDEGWDKSLATVSTSPNGQYVNSVKAESASKLNLYFVQEENGITKYRHPTDGGDNTDTNYSTIDLGGVTLTAGKSYVVTWTDWANHIGANWEDAWFTYTFAEIN